MEYDKGSYAWIFPVATQNGALKGTYSSKSISTVKAKKIKYLELFNKAIGK